MIKLLVILITGLGTNEMKVNNHLINHEFKNLESCNFVSKLIANDSHQLPRYTHRERTIFLCYDTNKLDEEDYYDIKN